jgi:hypothetical protein
MEKDLFHFKIYLELTIHQGILMSLQEKYQLMMQILTFKKPSQCIITLYMIIALKLLSQLMSL